MVDLVGMLRTTNIPSAISPVNVRTFELWKNVILSSPLLYVNADINLHRPLCSSATRFAVQQSSLYNLLLIFPLYLQLEEETNLPF